MENFSDKAMLRVHDRNGDLVFTVISLFGSKPGDAMYEIKTSVAEMFFGRVGTDTYRRHQK
jgi:hypothetical protein